MCTHLYLNDFIFCINSVNSNTSFLSFTLISWILTVCYISSLFFCRFLFKYWKYGLNIIVFGSWVDKISFKIVPRLSNIPRVATVHRTIHTPFFHFFLLLLRQIQKWESILSLFFFVIFNCEFVIVNSSLL
jgi:hypothetical protein